MDIDKDGTDEIIYPHDNLFTIYYYSNGTIYSNDFGAYSSMDCIEMYTVEGDNDETYIYYRTDYSYKSIQGYFSFSDKSHLNICLGFSENNDVNWEMFMNYEEIPFASGNDKTDGIYGSTPNAYNKLMSALPEHDFSISDMSSYTSINGLYCDDIVKKLSATTEKNYNINDYPVYLSALNTIVTDTSYRIYNNINEVSFALRDINNNNVPELITMTSSTDFHSVDEIYTIYNNSAEVICRRDPRYRAILCDDNLIMSFTAGGAGQGYYLQKYISGNTCETVKNLYSSYSDGNATYYNDDTIISESEYNSLVEAYQASEIALSGTPLSLVVTSQGGNAIINNAHIEVYSSTYTEGYQSYLKVNGDFSYIEVCISVNGNDEEYTRYSEDECKDSIYLMSYSSLGGADYTVKIIPYDTNGNFGDIYICSIRDAIHLMSSEPQNSNTNTETVPEDATMYHGFVNTKDTGLNIRKAPNTFSDIIGQIPKGTYIDVYNSGSSEEWFYVYVNIHGPEHHIIDGTCVLTAYHNAGGNIDLVASLREMAAQGERMPGATCGKWGVCGAVTSVGAALAIIDGTGPLTKNSTWGSHMKYTSAALSELAKIGSPRCCKRDGLIALKTAVSYMNSHYPVEIQWTDGDCQFHIENAQCLRGRCPFYPRPKVAFICIHNSCRSQIAEALGRNFAADVFESYSAGTETKPQINQDAVRLMKTLYGIDMEQSQYSKLISDIPSPDVAISMGCGVGCPFIERGFDDDWGLQDPTGHSDEIFLAVIKEIESRILDLRESLK